MVSPDTLLTIAAVASASLGTSSISIISSSSCCCTNKRLPSLFSSSQHRSHHQHSAFGPCRRRSKPPAHVFDHRLCYEVTNRHEYHPYCSGTTRSRRTPALYYSKDNNVKRDEEEEDTRRSSSSVIPNESSTAIEDGSPLGVAIVVLGGLWLVLGDGSLPMLDDERASIWVVFCTASIAAGISRLIRYHQKDR
jgi:hypothetical protein